MRYLVAVALVLSPLMVPAQTAPSAPTSQLAAMHSGVHTPKAPMSAAAADLTQPVVSQLRVSTGVVEPKLIYVTDIHQNAISALGRKVYSAGVSMIVDTEGKPTDLKIVKSAGPIMDADILEAVSQYRFRPGSVSGEKFAVPLTLYLQIQPSR